eukprot:763089-Hanusia_phi.AAC.1
MDLAQLLPGFSPAVPEQHDLSIPRVGRPHLVLPHQHHCSCAPCLRAHGPAVLGERGVDHGEGGP